MKNSMKVSAGICIIFLMTAFNFNVNAQVGPPPPPQGGHGQATNQPPQGGNAPVGNGVAFLLSIGLGYGIALISHRKKITAEEV